MPELLADESIIATADDFSPFSETISHFFTIEPQLLMKISVNMMIHVAK